MVLVVIVTRWAGFVAMAALVGGLILETFILPRDAPAVAAARRGLRRLTIICVAVLAVTTAGELIARTQTMAGGTVGAAISAVPSVLARTHFGVIWTVRLGALALALLTALATARAARIAVLILALAVTVTTSLTGHAADWGDLTWSAAIDWAHVLSVSAWTGGLLGLALCVLRAARDWPASVFTVVARRFSRLAGFCLLATVLSGSYNAWTQVHDVSALWTTFYGRALIAKLLLFLGLAWLGAVSRYTIVARLDAAHVPGLGERLFRLGRLAFRRRDCVPRQSLPSHLRAYVGREAVLVLLILGCTAVLVDSSPARHAGHGRHRVIVEPGPLHATMDERHESGGVPPEWIRARRHRPRRSIAHGGRHRNATVRMRA